MNYDVIVIGAGSAGLTAAIGASQIGTSVLLIEKNKIGGDCTHHGCVPSKALIKAARVAKHIKEASKFGLIQENQSNKNINNEDILNKVNAIIDSIYQHETPKEIEKFGISVEIGNPKFINGNTISIDSKEFTAKKIIIATGSRAFIPEIPGLDTIKFMTNKEIFNPKTYSSLAVFGAGPIGCELGQAFANLGIDVTIINTRDNILPREDSDAGKLLEKQLIEDNISLCLAYDTIKIEEKNKIKIIHLKHKETKKTKIIEVDEILVATGRRPNIENLGLEKANIEYTTKGISIDKYGRTTNKNVYAAGDVNGSMQFTHLANSHAKSILTKIIFRLPVKLETQVIPRVTFTTPEIASIGIGESEKEETDSILLKEYKNIDRAITDSNTNGFFKIIVNKKGFIRGATLVGEGSGELIGEIALAMKNNINITKLADTIHPYPTYGYGLRNCADQFRGLGFTANKKKWVKRIFRLNGK
jgi:pyruvate/2-oxoglutarate dehydrogenase complex dihydrolipoamide dehydrogenase (E3) component